jgi:hypothetical protein
MSDFITLSCPSCGGQLAITDDIHRFACTHCGTEHMVKRAPGIIAIEPVVHGLANIQRGTDRTASELAIVRLRGEMEYEWQKEQSLAIELLEKDFGGTATALIKIRKITSSRFFKLSPSNQGHMNKVFNALLDLTPRETGKAAEQYRLHKRFKNKNAKEAHTLFHKIRDAKRNLFTIKVSLEKHEESVR